MSSDTIGTDPWDWSVDRVIQELSTPNCTWAPKYPKSIPDASFISTMCKENGIDGCILLNEVSGDTLKELIKPIAWRSYVRDAIEQLRSKSQEYYKTHKKTERTNQWEVFLSELAQETRGGFSMPAALLEAIEHGDMSEIEPWLNEDPRREEGLQYLLQKRKSKLPERSLLRLPSSAPRTGDPEVPNHGTQGTTLVSDKSGSKRQKLDHPTTAAGSTLYNEELPHDIETFPDKVGDDLISAADNHTPSPSSHGKRKRSASPAQQPTDGSLKHLLQQGEDIHEESQTEALPAVPTLDMNGITSAVEDATTDEQPPIPPAVPIQGKKRAVLVTIGPPTAEGLANLEAQRAQISDLRQFIYGPPSTETIEATKESTESQYLPRDEQATDRNPESPTMSVSKETERVEIVRIGSPIAQELTNFEAQRAEVAGTNGYIHGRTTLSSIVAGTGNMETVVQEQPTQERDAKNDSQLPINEEKPRLRLKTSRLRRGRDLTESACYLPRKKIPADEIFYENTAYGDDMADADDNMEFSFLHQSILPGRAKYINNCMKHYMLYEPQTITEVEKPFTVVRPYPENLLYASDSAVHLIEPSCTVFYKNYDGEVHAERGLICNYPELEKRERELRGERRQRRPGYGWPKPIDLSHSDEDPWMETSLFDSIDDVQDAISEHDEAEFEIDPNATVVLRPPVQTSYRGLLHPRRTVFMGKEGRFLFGTTERTDPETYTRYLEEKWSSMEGGAKVLPVFGDSGSENEYDDKFWKELGREKSEAAVRAMRQFNKRTKKRTIPLHEISETVDKALAKFEEKWALTKLEKLRATAWSLWTGPRNKGTLATAITNAEKKLASANRRLMRWREELMSMEWSSKAEVRKVSGTLQETTFDVNEWKWKLSTLQAESAPPKPVKQPRILKEQPAKISAAAGEEQDIRQEDIDEDATLNDFVVPDDDEELGSNAEVEDEQDQEPQDSISKVSSPNQPMISAADRTTPTKKLRHPSSSRSSVSGQGQSSIPPASGSRSSPITLETTSVQNRSSTRNLQPNNSVVDLTQSSPLVTDLVTPEKKSESSKRQRFTPNIKLRLTNSKSPFRISSQLSPPAQNQGEMPDQENLPDYDDPTAINRYTFVAWSRLFDADRLLIKAFCELPTSRRADLFSYISDRGISDTSRNKFWDTVRTVVLALNSGKQSKLGMQPDTFVNLKQFIQLFHIFADGHNGIYQPLDKSLSGFGNRNTVLNDVLSNKQSYFSDFWGMCCNMESYFENFDSQVSPLSTPSRIRISEIILGKKRTAHEGEVNDEDEDSEGSISSAKRRKLNRDKARVTHSGDDTSDAEYTPSPSVKLLKLITRREAEVDHEDTMEGDDSSYSSLKRSRELTDIEALDQASTHIKRKKQVHPDKQAQARREQDREQQSQQVERRQRLQEKLLQSGRNEDLDLARLIINAADDPECAVRVHKYIAHSIKSHQIDGVRFLWNQIVTPSDENSMQGCLLAHTMGLGKTMQTITLLVAIAETASSINPSVSSQVPKSLQVSKTLILCPPSLVDNWMDELLTWVPEDLLGQFRKVDTPMSEEGRFDAVSAWFTEGGVLLIGYSLFRKIAGFKVGKSKDPQKAQTAADQLLQGANIVVFDEAHYLKNLKAALTQVARKVRTKSRIALTGSPLANNLEEYYSLIELVAPGYLGDYKEFKAVYMEPIEAGLYEDSNGFERRRSLKMLKVLDAELAPKINRASMLVLKEDMPEKKEFVITVPLTPIQHKAYVLYVRSMLERSAFPQTKSGDVVQTTMWHWLAVLSLLCNHPACFKAKLDQSRNDAQNTSVMAAPAALPTEITDVDTAVDPEAHVDAEDDLDAPLYKCGVSEDVIARELRLFEETIDITAVELSYKMVLLCQILDAAKAAGDKTLVFSGSIETLNYLERLFTLQRRRFNRLDGATKSSLRQQMTKDFNSDEADVKIDVFLISTRAGGVGLNLQGANRVVIFDFKFNPSHEEQAVGRAYRIGQQKETFVYRFVAGGTFETSVHNKAIYKLQLASRVVDKRTPIAQAKKSLGEFLHEPKDVPQLDLSGSQGKDPLVLDKILATQGQNPIIREIVPTDTFNRDADERLTAEEEKEVKQLSFESNLRRTNPKKWEEIQHKTVAAVFKSSNPVLQGHSSASPIAPQMPPAVPFSRGPYQPPVMSFGAPSFPSMNGFTLHAPPRYLDQQLGYSKPAPVEPILKLLLEARERYAPEIRGNLPVMRAEAIRNFVEQPSVAPAERISLHHSVLERLKDGPTCHRLLTNDLSVDDFMQDSMEFQRQPSSSGMNGQPTIGKVCTPQTSPYFSASQQQQLYSLPGTVKSPVHNYSVADSSSQPATGRRSMGATDPSPGTASSPGASKYDSWTRPQLLVLYLQRLSRAEFNSLKDRSNAELIAGCKDWDARIRAEIPPSPVKPPHAPSEAAQRASRAATPGHEQTSPPRMTHSETTPTKSSFDKSLDQDLRMLMQNL